MTAAAFLVLTVGALALTVVIVLECWRWRRSVRWLERSAMVVVAMHVARASLDPATEGPMFALLSSVLVGVLALLWFSHLLRGVAPANS